MNDVETGSPHHHLCFLSGKSPRPEKQVLHFRPPPTPQNTPTSNEEFYGHGGFLAARVKNSGGHNIGAAMSGLRIAGRKCIRFETCIAPAACFVVKIQENCAKLVLKHFQDLCRTVSKYCSICVCCGGLSTKQATELYSDTLPSSNVLGTPSSRARTKNIPLRRARTKNSP